MRIFCFLWVIQGFAAFNLTWGIPSVPLDSNPPLGDTDNHPALALDPNGNAIAVWSRTQDQGASEKIWAATYNHSLRVWSGAMQISAEGSASNPQVAMDDKGNAIILWEEGFPTQILSRTLSCLGVWSPPLSSPAAFVSKSPYPQTSPRLVVDAQGNALAIWMESLKEKQVICSAKKKIQDPWISMGLISSGEQNATLSSLKALSLNEQEQAMAVWEESQSSFSEIHGAFYRMGSWLSSIPLSSTQTHSAKFPSVKIDKTGRAILVWSQEGKIFSKTFFEEILSDLQLISDPTYLCKYPQIEIDEKGNALVVFEKYDTLHKFISAAELRMSSSQWSAPLDISAPSPFDDAIAGYPIFSMNQLGDGIVIWKEWNGSNRIIQATGYSLGSWSSIKTLSSLSANAGANLPSFDMSVAVNNAGHILAIWPEDPNGKGSLQMKATAGVGFANAGPLPPSPDPEMIFSGIITGKQILRRFPCHGDLINILSWTSSQNVAYFNIYRGSFSSLIGSTKKNRFEDHQRTPKEKVTYLITSVDSHGQESGPMTIVVNPL